LALVSRPGPRVKRESRQRRPERAPRDGPVLGGSDAV
jgi:hypothetical protein